MGLSRVAHALICFLGLVAPMAAQLPQGTTGASSTARLRMSLRDVAHAEFFAETPPQSPNNFFVAAGIYIPLFCIFVARDPDSYCRLFGRNAREHDGFVLCMYTFAVGMLYTTLGVSVVRPYIDGTPPANKTGMIFLPMYFLGWFAIFWLVLRGQFQKEQQRMVAAREPREPLLPPQAPLP